MKLVNNWKSAYKWLSMHCMAYAGAIQGAWLYIPDDLRQNVPHNLVNIITVCLLFFGIVGRLVQQGD